MRSRAGSFHNGNAKSSLASHRIGTRSNHTDTAPQPCPCSPRHAPPAAEGLKVPIGIIAVNGPSESDRNDRRVPGNEANNPLKIAAPLSTSRSNRHGKATLPSPRQLCSVRARSFNLAAPSCDGFGQGAGRGSRAVNGVARASPLRNQIFLNSARVDPYRSVRLGRTWPIGCRRCVHVPPYLQDGKCALLGVPSSGWPAVPFVAM
jgi:hypothetical protein